MAASLTIKRERGHAGRRHQRTNVKRDTHTRKPSQAQASGLVNSTSKSKSNSNSNDKQASGLVSSLHYASSHDIFTYPEKPAQTTHPPSTRSQAPRRALRQHSRQSRPFFPPQTRAPVLFSHAVRTISVLPRWCPCPMLRYPTVRSGSLHATYAIAREFIGCCHQGPQLPQGLGRQ